MVKRLAIGSVLGVVVTATMAFAVTHSDAAPTDTPLPVTPYSGFNPSLTRAPYVSDLTLTSAYVNWATTSSTPGSVQVTPTVNGFCPTAVTTWSPSAIQAPLSLPGPVNPSSATGNMTSASFQVVNGTSTTNENQWSVPLSGLSAGTQYCYAVFSSNSSGAVDLLPSSQPDQTFTTLDPAGSTKSLTFDVVDDLAETYYATGASFPGNLNTDQAALDKQIGTSGARFAILAGDTAYNDGSQSNYGDLDQNGVEISDMFGPSYWPQTGGIPTFHTDGDHGLNSPTDLQIWPTPVTASSSGGTYAYDSYPPGFGNPTVNEPDTWYAIQSGNVRIYVLDAAWNEQSNLGNTTGSLCSPTHALSPECQQYEMDYNEHWATNSPEYQWLAADLAAHPGGVKMAVFHYPLRSDNPSQPSDVYLQNSSSNPNQATSLESLLSANGVDLAFSGHAHTYPRIDPGQPGQITNYVTGGGGGVLEPVDSGAGCDNPGAKDAYALGWSPGSTPPSGSGSSCGATAPPASSLSAADVYNFLQITVSGNQVTVSPTNAAGHTFDVHTYTLGSLGGSSPTTPGNVNATATSSSSVQVNWTASTEAGGTIKSYNVYRNGAQIGTVNAPATGFTDTGALPSTTYTYSVIALDNVGHSSGPGTSKPVTTPPPPTRPGTGPPPGPAPTACMAHLPAGSVVASAALGDGSGYYEVDSSGDVAAFGAAACYGAMTGLPLNRPIVGMAVDPATGGYWLVATDGGIFSFNAPFFGSTGNIALNKPIVGMAPTPSGGGYWMVASDGGVFTFGDNHFFGSTGNIALNKPVVGMAVDPATGGYWLVATDGGIFSFNAPFYGSTGAVRLNQPVVGMAAASDGSGYRLVATDGGVFCFNLPFFGSTGAIRLNRPMVAGLNDNATGGYWLTASDGGVFSFNAPFLGSAA